MSLRLALISMVLALTAALAAAQPAEVSRVLRSFDFEERNLGNVEELPMHWTKVEGAGLPHYVNAELATDCVHAGRYSFRFDLNGGSLIYRYDAGQIPVQRDAHYRIEGFVRATPMENARARMTAYFTDLDGHPIATTVRHSDLIAATANDQQAWKKVSVELAADSPDDAYLVIELALLQPALYSAAELGEHSLFPQDIHGTAWFDDVTVSQVPQITLGTGHPGNIFRRSDERQLSVLVNDRFTDDLSAQLVVHDAGGKVVYQKSGALDMKVAEALGPGRKRMSISLPSDLPSGWYEAALEMSSQGKFVGRQTLDFVLLADDAKPVVPDSRFGLIATNLPFEGWSELPDILPLLCAGRVKLAVWSDEGDIQQQDAAGFDRLLERLRDLQITPTAVLTTLPPNVREKIRAARNVGLARSSSFDTKAVLASAAENPLLQILSSPTETWQPQLAYVIARHANHLDRWQLGEDGSDLFITQPKMREVYRRIYNEFQNLVQKPDLAMPWPAWYELDGNMPATVALHVKPDVLPSQLPLYMADIQKGASAGGPSLSLYLEPLDRKQYGREMQIRDLAQRICYALAADAKRIDLQLPFTVERDGEIVRKQPQELLMIVRTIIRTLGNAQFKGKVPIADGIEAFLFDRNGEGILMLWDQGNQAGVKQLALNVGSKPVRVDLWGNATALLRSTEAANSGSVPLEIGPMPTFLVGIDAQLAELRASIGFDNDRIESSFKPHTRHVRFTNAYKSAISGMVKLTPPKGWTINPPSQSFTLNPGETFDREITIEFPYNSFAGPKTIAADFQIQAESNERFVVPMILKLGLSEVGVQTFALRDGADVVVQQIITNYSDHPIDYSAYAMFPGQARQERLVTNLGAGRTTIKKYRFNNVTAFANAKVRSGVKELSGTRVLNDEVPVQ